MTSPFVSAWRKSLTLAMIALLSSFLPNTLLGTDNPSQPLRANEPLNLVVMDPLAAPLACDCVQGYAQRKYEKLALYLKKKLGREVNVVWAESLETALQESNGSADLIIGKHSVVLSDAKQIKMQVVPVAQLTDQKGETFQTGLIVVRAADQATKVSDLKDYRIFFGPADCDEKSAAPMALLKKFGVDLPEPIETSPACSSAATKLMELDSKIDAAAVISSYAEPLLEGCGQIQKGDLRVIGVSEPVPFITAFLNKEISQEERSQILSALIDAETEPKLLIALESLAGFVEWKPAETEAKKK